MNQPLIAITGATGLVGSKVAHLLSGKGLKPRGIVRDLQRAASSGLPDIKRASAYVAFDEMLEALQGVHTLFLVPAAETLDRVQQHKTAVDAALAAGVSRIVYLSFLGAAPDATFTLARDHWHTEQHIRAMGLSWTFLRMNLYMDFIPSMVLADGTIRGPAGSGRLSALLRDDVAASCASVLERGKHDGKTYDLTGCESFSMAEAASALSKPGRTVRFVDETDEEAWQSRQQFGAPEFEVRGWISSYQAIRDGSLECITTHVTELTGREPATLAEYLRHG